MNQKYKILIADDEYWVRRKLVSLLDWEALGLQCLEPAKDGQETLERVRREKPDILVTDINMPFLNGVELLQKVQQEQPEIVSFVVSGYDDFEYVKGSFLGGGINYLLKPVSREDLESAVTKALEIIAAREDQKRKVRKASSVLRDTEFSQLVRERETTALPTGSMTAYLGMDHMALMLVKIHNLYSVTRQFDHDMSLYSFQIKQDILQAAGREDLILFNHIYRPGEFMIITEMGRTEMQDLAGRILAYFARYPETCLTISMTENTYSIERIHTAYREAVAGLMSREFDRTNRVFFAASRELPAETAGKLEPETVKQIQKHLHSGNKQALLRLLLEDSGLGNCRGWQYAQVLQLVKELGMHLSGFAAKYRPGRIMADMDSLTENIARTVETLDLHAVHDAIKAAVEYLDPGLKEFPVDTTRHIIRQAAAYIDENYFEDLTLSSLSEKFNVESSYFSRMFRQEMGENLILYITKKRIEKARLYIANADINLTEIAFMVGYNDYSYFNRVFKKNTGVSPREYRNQLNAQEGIL